MAAFFPHRKLMPFSNLTQLCSSICNNTLNNNTTAAVICPIPACSAVCSQICCPEQFFFFPLSPLQSPPQSPDYASTTHSKLSSTLKISISLLVVTFSIFVLYTLYKFYTVWSRSRQNHHHPSDHDEGTTTRRDDFLDQDHGPLVDHPIWYIRTIGLQPNLISAITVVKYKKGEGLVEGTDCSVCLSEFQEDEMLRLLPKCSHAFHIPCIDTWLRSHTNCPLCRAGIVRNGVSSLSLPEESVVEDLNTLEESQVEILVNNGELETEREDDSGSELRVGTEEEDEILSKLEMGNGEVLLRRSVSLDCLSAARLSAEIANAQTFQADGILGTKSEKAENLTCGGVIPSRVEGSCLIARSLQRGPEFIKRSFSCSGKVLFSRQSR